MKARLLIKILLVVIAAAASVVTVEIVEPWLAAVAAVVGVLWFICKSYVRGKALSKKKWKCPQCAEVFNAGSWHSLEAASSDEDCCRIRCPRCNKSGWCGMVS